MPANLGRMDAGPLLDSVAVALAEVKLEAILIGNAAAAIQGAPVTTMDFDFMFREMIACERAVILDVAVDETENCFPMIPSGAAHNEMLLGPEDEREKPVSEEGMVLV